MMLLGRGKLQQKKEQHQAGQASEKTVTSRLVESMMMHASRYFRDRTPS
jgi:hypothetical protein